jgi:hypothetical protein
MFTRDKCRVSVSTYTAGAYTATLLVMVYVIKGGGHAPPTLPAWAYFTLMMECTPESSRFYSMYSVVATLAVAVRLSNRSARSHPRKARSHL